MNPQPMLFLGDRRRQALTNRVADCLRRWRQSWARDSNDAFEVSAEAPKAGGFGDLVAGATTHCWALDMGEQRIAVLLLPHSTFVWAVHEGNFSSIDTALGEGSLAEMLEREVALSLLIEICMVDRDGTASVSRLAADTLADWSRDAHAWTLHGRAGVRGCSVLVASSRVEMLAPARTPARGPALESRRAAIGANTVEVRAMVGEASMPVSELAELALDDVLVLDQPLSGPVTLVAPESGTVIATGNLGRAGARRAVRLASVPAQRI
jgi:flagellar motor switch/type III secretory pathway protein FliN